MAPNWPADKTAKSAVSRAPSWPVVRAATWAVLSAATSAVLKARMTALDRPAICAVVMVARLPSAKASACDDDRAAI